MRNYAISAALLGCVALAGCSAFTAGEPVTEPDPVAVRKAQTPEPTEESAKPASPHGARPPSPHGASPHGAKEAAQGEQPETATAAHILIRYAGAMRTSADVTRSKEAAKKLAQEVARKASAPGADFAALADQYTEDPSGKGRGGKLGTFPKGRMVPEFDKPLFELRPGQVSDVIETPFGFHVIYRES